MLNHGGKLAIGKGAMAALALDRGSQRVARATKPLTPNPKDADETCNNRQSKDKPIGQTRRPERDQGGEKNGCQDQLDRKITADWEVVTEL
jgi:hypothetical protein